MVTPKKPLAAPNGMINSKNTTGCVYLGGALSILLVMEAAGVLDVTMLA
jgi:hypothetical protein